MYRFSKTVVCALLILVTGTVCAQELYRYEDDDGHMVWGTAVPSHLASRGYRIFDTKGRFIREVPRTLSFDAQEERERSLAMEARESELKERQRQLDNMLLRRYSSVDDFETRRKQSMAALDDRRLAAKFRVDEVNAQIEILNVALLKASRRGDKPPAVQVSQKANLDVTRLRLMQDLAQVDEEIRSYREQSDLEYQRLRELMSENTALASQP